MQPPIYQLKKFNFLLKIFHKLISYLKMYSKPLINFLVQILFAYNCVSQLFQEPSMIKILRKIKINPIILFLSSLLWNFAKHILLTF